MSSAQPGLDARRVTAEFRSGWGWFVVLGVVLCVLGLLALANLAIATVVSVFYVGALMIVGAVVEIIHAFQVRSWRGFFFWFLSGVLYGAAGFVAFANPVLAAAALTLVLAATLIVAGILRVWSSLQLGRESGWGWLLASGVITILAGIIFAIGWPVNSLWLLGMVLAIDLVFQGVTAIAFGLALRVPR